ncbi:hypothetical protein I2W78_34885 [Streptomyces spinoverrucosus]|uniref:hypothetical protein n=1 Tax=Streptomyces spinoverrucosus TaxID=284043 RepID=UPI0018C3C63C|nr:hypothetical protein [Streptomyces spinoverrucosus]MBG0856900.1 hypothetical protein [Streptomyces spinoverrucosus]
MHRTTTTALLVTVALSAVSGCVTVQRGPTAVPPVPVQPTAPGPDGRTEPQIVQAPAREALEMIGPSRRPDPTTPEPRRPTTEAPSPTGQPPASRTESRPRPAPPTPEPRRSYQPPPARIPDVSGTIGENTDVCALGRKYGGWRPDSPEAVICEQTYGR